MAITRLHITDLLWSIWDVNSLNVDADECECMPQVKDAQTLSQWHMSLLYNIQNQSWKLIYYERPFRRHPHLQWC